MNAVVKKGTHLDAQEVVNYLESIPIHSIFSLTFEKKDGTNRKMRCQRGVKKKLKGGESTIKDHPNLQGVYDMDALDENGEKGAYRSFDKGRVKMIKGGGHPALMVAGIDDLDVYDAHGNIT